MTTKRQVTAVVASALDAALDGDFTVEGLAAVVTDALVGEFTIQAKPARGSMQGDMGPQHPNYRCDCVCVIPCASGTCRYPIAHDNRPDTV